MCETVTIIEEYGSSYHMCVQHFDIIKFMIKNHIMKLPKDEKVS